MWRDTVYEEIKKNRISLMKLSRAIDRSYEGLRVFFKVKAGKPMGAEDTIQKIGKVLGVEFILVPRKMSVFSRLGLGEAEIAVKTRLIDAAPELYEALKPFANLECPTEANEPDSKIITCTFTLGNLRRVTRALALAEGREWNK